jgi:hypothetical protein
MPLVAPVPSPEWGRPAARGELSARPSFILNRTLLRAAGLTLLPGAAFAQTGLSGATGGIIGLLFAALLAVFGLVSSITSVLLLFRKGPGAGRIALLVVGLLAMSPALLLLGGLAWVTWQEMRPRAMSFDFSAGRSVAGLDPKRRRTVDLPDSDAAYSFQGNVYSTVRLPGNRHWTGRAEILYVDAFREQAMVVDWKGKRDQPERIYAEARRILSELQFTGHALDSWYAGVRAGEWKEFRVESEPEPRIEVRVRGIPGDPLETPIDKRVCFVNVRVAWTAPGI